MREGCKRRGEGLRARRETISREREIADLI